MKFIIAIDCEGVSCVVGNHSKALSASSDYQFSRKQAALEANAAIKGLFDSGAKEVLVWDSHGEGINLDPELIDSRCRLILGRGFDRRFPGLDEHFTGVLMIGYHAMEGTLKGVLAHTYSSESYRQIKINGQPVGEIALDAAVAGSFGVPLILISSDRQGCREARERMPWVKTVETKIGHGRNCAVSKHPETVKEEIYTQTRAAVRDLSAMYPFNFKSPVKIDIQFKTIFQAFKSIFYRRRGWALKNLTTITRVFDSIKNWNC